MARRIRRTSVTTVLRQTHVSAENAPHVRALFEALVRFQDIIHDGGRSGGGRNMRP